ncbi:MAG: BamA/TamA family outer membrane protein [Bacteroidota bacterium]
MKRVLQRWLLILMVLLPLYPQAQVMFPTDNADEDGNMRKRRIVPLIYYSNPDRIFAGLKFVVARGRIKDDPYGYEQSVQLRYSITQNSFSAVYDGTFKELIGKWNLSVNAYYDWLVWTNFFGLGNETQRINPIKYYRLSTSEYAANVGVNRLFADHHYVDVTAYMQGIEVFKQGTLVTENYLNNKTYYFEHHTYASMRASYTYQDVDDHVLPRKGVMLYGAAGYTVNTFETEKSFAKLNGIAQAYLPLFGKFSLSVRAAGSTITGTPEFYQYVTVGGPMNLRGYWRDRFWGNTAFYNSNELRYITDMRIGKYTGQVGVIGLFDNGRVWLDNEHSDKMHYSYGGGLLVCPMHKFTGSITYAQTNDDGGLVQLRITKLLNKMTASRGGTY